MSTPGLVTVDDTDTTKITYKGDWMLQGNATSDYMGSVHRTTSSAASATFVFNGTSVQVYGTLPPSAPPSSQYTLDDRPPTLYKSHNVSSEVFQQRLYVSPQLSDGLHTLVIQPTLDGPHFYIDFVQYIPSGSASSVTYSGAAKATPSNTSFNKAGSKAGQIAGGVLGGLAALSILFSLILFVLGRRRDTHVNRKRADLPESHPLPMSQNTFSAATLTPFVLPPSSAVTRSAGKSGSATTTYPSTTGTRTCTLTPVPSQAGTSTVETGEVLEPFRHRDAGAVPIQLQRAELPPAYEDRAEEPSGAPPPKNGLYQHR